MAANLHKQEAAAAPAGQPVLGAQTRDLASVMSGSQGWIFPLRCTLRSLKYLLGPFPPLHPAGKTRCSSEVTWLFFVLGFHILQIKSKSLSYS